MATKPQKDETHVTYSGEAYVQRLDGRIEKLHDLSILSPDTMHVLSVGRVMFAHEVGGLVATSPIHLLADVRGLEGNRDPHRFLLKFIGRKLM